MDEYEEFEDELFEDGEWIEVDNVSGANILKALGMSQIKGKEENVEYNSWICNGGTYTAAINVKVEQKMLSGIYKVKIIGEQYACVPQVLTSDGLYTLPDSVMTKILEEADKFWNRKDAFKQYEILHKRGILLEGPAGTGKSSIITLLINQLIKEDGLIFLVNSLSDFTYLYDFLKNSIRKIEPDRHIITVIEDIDKLILSGNIASEILDFLDGKMSIEHHLVILTTNDTSELPDALLRPSRIDLREIIDLPNDEVRKKFFELKGVKEDDIDKFVIHSKNFSISQLKELFIAVYVLGNDFDESIHALKNPKAKKKYSTHNHNKTTAGFNI